MNRFAQGSPWVGLLLIFLSCNWHIAAQSTLTGSTLTLSDAIAQALEHNYDLLLAQNEAEVDALNHHPGNAGLLPTIAVNSSYNYSRNNTELEFANDIPPNNTDGAQSRSVQYGLQFNYRLFDGLGSVYSYRQLGNSAAIGDLEARITAESILLQTVELYLNTVLAQEQIQITWNHLQISADRLRRANVAQEVGASNQLERLGAEVNYNADSITWMNARIQYDELKRGLCLIMGQPIDIQFSVENRIELSAPLDQETLIKEAGTNNAALLSSAYAIQSAELGVKKAKSSRAPVLDFTAGYGFTQNNNDVGILLRQQNLGLNAGVTLRWNLFNGGQVHRSVAIAKSALESNEIMAQKVSSTVKRDVLNAYEQYEHLSNIWPLQQLNTRVAKRFLEQSKEQFELGIISATAYREAQNDLLQAELTEQSTQVQLKLAELELLRLSGRLITP